MKKFGITLAGLLCATVLLTACGNNDSQKKSASSSTSSSQVTSSSQATSRQSTSSQTNRVASSSSAASSVSEKNPVAHIVPASLQGTWYSVGDDGSQSTVNFTSSSMSYTGSGESSTSVFHQRSSDADVNDIHNDWVVGNMMTVRGLNYLNMMGWNQTAGDGESYVATTENYNGQTVTVLVEAGGAGFWVDGFYYRSADQAQQMQGVQFTDDTRLEYR